MPYFDRTDTPLTHTSSSSTALCLLVFVDGKLRPPRFCSLLAVAGRAISFKISQHFVREKGRERVSGISKWLRTVIET